MSDMKFSKISESNQEQAVAAWINYLNQVRLDHLMESLNNQNVNLQNAMDSVDEAMDEIDKYIIGRNRGGAKGMHGFIAEVAECGVGNARRQILGKMPNYQWINDNGPVDLVRDGVNIQQKFVQFGNHLSLEAIAQHYKEYPWFLAKGGKYQIPKDHYEKILRLLSMSEKEANKLPKTDGDVTLKQWKEVHEFFARGDIKVQDLEPSEFDYKDVQAGKIHDTLQCEKNELRKQDKEIRSKAYDASKPNLNQAVNATVVAAVAEGGMTFISEIVRNIRSGKKVNDFSNDDWSEILRRSGISSVKGGIRGVTIYALTNYTATPAAVASALCTASFAIAEQAHLLRTGKINETEFLENSQIICLDSSVSALSSFIGQAVIPVPVLGAVIGNSVGMFVYQIAKDNLSKKEMLLVDKYLKELDSINAELEERYRIYINKLNCAMTKYYEILNAAFSPNYAEAFDGSIMLAEFVGVPTEKILKNKQEIDQYFLE